MGTERKAMNYGVGALAVFVISLGVAGIAYGSGVIPFVLYASLLNIPAWIFGPLGVYTLIYSVIARKDFTYYMVWGTIMFAIAVISTFYYVSPSFPLIVFGILLVIIAIIGIIAYWRSKK